MRIPAHGLAPEALYKELDTFARHDLPWNDGRTWGYVYDPGPEADTVGKQAYMRFLNINALDFTVFPSTLELEKTLVAMAAAHAGGDANVVGNFTSGGTESIMLAVKAARDHSRLHRPGVTEPEMILPITAHAAFHKAAHYLGVKVVPTAVDEHFRADPEAVRQAITPNTIMMVGSAPSYAHGVVDPIAELGRIAGEHDIWLHCDACVGGFLLPYFRRLGASIPDYDFSVPGVRSLSMDLHKFAYTPKGASIVLYRNKSYRRHQIFACAKWTGYTIINNAVQSSKTAGPMAAAWAVINYLGDDGYLELARRSHEATRRLVDGIRKIGGLEVMTEPDFCMFSFTSPTISIFHIIDEMRARNWYIQPQFAFGPSRENIHLSVGASNAQWIEPFLADLEASTRQAETMESGQYMNMAMEHLGTLPPDADPHQAFEALLGVAGFESVSSMPERWAPINEILNALPAELRELALTEYVNDIFQPDAR